MSRTFNIYCDESCHLENDHQQSMVLGAIWCPMEKTKDINAQIHQIKIKHSMQPTFEAKWTKISPAKQQLYTDLIEYFFENNDLHFRGLIVPDKSKLRHEAFHQNHNDWYYKMYFDMIKVILEPEAHYRIYLDIKDTQSAIKMAKLHEVLCNSLYDFSCTIIERVQTVRSHEIEILQLTDLLIGALSYVNRGLATSQTKLDLINLIRERSHYSLTKTTLLREDKFNIFRWHANEGQV